jgi:hypothetical protein
MSATTAHEDKPNSLILALDANAQMTAIQTTTHKDKQKSLILAPNANAQMTATQTTTHKDKPKSLIVLHAKSMAPASTPDVLEDIEAMQCIKGFKVYGEDSALLNSNRVGSDGKGEGYSTMQDLLLDTKSGFEERWCNMEWLVRNVRTSTPSATAHATLRILPALQKEFHRRLAELLAKLSPSAQRCLQSGMKFLEVEYAWDQALQERNNAYLVVELG